MTLQDFLNTIIPPSYDVERGMSINAVPSFKIIKENYTFTSNNFEVIAYVKKTTTHPDFNDLTVTAIYLLKHKTKGTFFLYSEQLFDSDKWNREPRLREYTKSEAQKEYLELQNIGEHYYPEKHFLKTYEEAFGKMEEY